MHIHEGAWARRVQPRIGAKVNNLSLGWLKSGGQHPYPVFHLGCGLSSYRTQRYIIMCILWGVTRTLTELLFDCLFSIPAFICSLKIIIIETCSRASILIRVRLQNVLGQNEFSHVKKAIPGSLSPGTSYPICLQSGCFHVRKKWGEHLGTFGQKE